MLQEKTNQCKKELRGLCQNNDNDKDVFSLNLRAGRKKARG